MSTVSLLQSLTSAPIWTLLADLPLTAKRKRFAPRQPEKGSRGVLLQSQLLFVRRQTSSSMLRPNTCCYFLDGQHTGFYVTVFPAADILDPASDGLGKLSLGHACSLTGSLSFISHFYPSFLQFDFLFLAAWGVAPTFS